VSLKSVQSINQHKLVSLLQSPAGELELRSGERLACRWLCLPLLKPARVWRRWSWWRSCAGRVWPGVNREESTQILSSDSLFLLSLSLSLSLSYLFFFCPPCFRRASQDPSDALSPPLPHLTSDHRLLVCWWPARVLLKPVQRVYLDRRPQVLSVRHADTLSPAPPITLSKARKTTCGSGGLTFEARGSRVSGQRSALHIKSIGAV
jgi:hypothetical protein